MMKHQQFVLLLFIPWLIAWLIANLLLTELPPLERAEETRRLTLLEESIEAGRILDDLDNLIFSTHINAQLQLFDTNTDTAIVQLGELSNRLANSSNTIGERWGKVREKLASYQGDVLYFPRGQNQLEEQYEQIIHHIDEYISNLGEILRIISSNEQDLNNFPSLISENNKVAMRAHLRIRQLSARFLLLQNRYTQFTEAALTPQDGKKRLFIIIGTNIFFLLILLPLWRLSKKYKYNFNKLAEFQNKEQAEAEKAEGLKNRLSAAEEQSQRLRHELALLRLYHETLANNIRLGMVMVDKEGVLLSANQTARELLLLGDKEKEKPLKSLPWWHNLDRRSELELALKTVIKTRNLQKVDNLILNFPEAPKRFLNIVISPYTTETGQLYGTILLIDDVSATNTMRRRLLENERLATVGRLAAQVAHEIRNPLSSIALNSDLLNDEIGENGDKEEAAALLASIQKEVTLLTEITERYLDLARLPMPEKVKADIHEIIKETISFYSAELQNSHITVEQKLLAEKPFIQVDPGQIRQALLNILRNSKEAMPGGGLISIATISKEDRVFITISDTGSGVPEKERAAIFDPFFSTKKGGTGLGLSITLQLIGDNQGSIRYLDIAGKGASFELSFLTITA